MKKWILIAGLFACTVSDKTKRDQFFLQGNEQLAQKEYKQAIQFYDLSIQLDPDFAEGYNNRGVAKVEYDRPEEAILDYNQAILIRPGYKDALLNRAYAYEALGRFDDALTDVQFLENQSPDSSYIHFYKGILLNAKRNYSLAKHSFKKAASLDPSNLEARVNLSTVHYFLNEFDSAREVLKEVIRENPQEPNAYNTFSQVYIAEGDYPNALFSINHALKLVPNEPYFLNNRGFIYLQMDSLGLAATDINRSIAADPKNAWAYRNKGIYFLKSGDPGQAVRLLNEAIRRGSFVDELYSYLGEALLAQGKKGDACDSWRKGVALNEKRSGELLSRFCN